MYSTCTVLYSTVSCCTGCAKVDFQILCFFIFVCTVTFYDMLDLLMYHFIRRPLSMTRATHSYSFICKQFTGDESLPKMSLLKLAVGVFLATIVVANPIRAADRHPPFATTAVKKLAADTDPQTLNVHVVPHTHDDVGWRKTVEQYFYGYNNSIDSRGTVTSILTTMVESLLQNPARTFTYVEMKYFRMWWNEASDAQKDSVRWLIANEQLTFTNGGHCMHDEASTHYIGMMDQTTLGHDFLLRELGVVPSVGWQLDPFGHSATQASLLTARAGLDAIYFGRIDYQDLQLRQLTQQCEGLWNASRDLEDSAIFWGLTGSYEGNYGPPEGYSFDILYSDEPLVGANETRLMERIHTFLEDLRIQSDRTQGNHIMVTMGSDFHYMQAQYNFANLDILFGTIMNYQQWNLINIPGMFGPEYDRVNIFYSSPEYYTKMKYEESKTGTYENQPKWNVKTDDFFPYSDCPHCFWTGYFTSRTAFKRFERVASGFLLAARQVEAISSLDVDEPLFSLEDELGVVQHHDGVSGTAKQHVADDYSKRLQTGLNAAADFVVSAIKHLMLDKPKEDLQNLMFCQLLNETLCETSEVRRTVC
jgi:alpha-mannosidase